MSMKIGGNYKCYHGIDTDSLDEWNEHLLDPENGHTFSGTTKCIGCGVTMVFDGIPFYKLAPNGLTVEGTNIKMTCPTCQENIANEYQNKQIIQIENPSKGFRMIESHEKGGPTIVNMKQNNDTSKKSSKGSKDNKQ